MDRLTFPTRRRFTCCRCRRRRRRKTPRGRKAHQCFPRVIENGNGGGQLLTPYKVRNSSEKRKAKYCPHVEVVENRIPSHAAQKSLNDSSNILPDLCGPSLAHY